MPSKPKKPKRNPNRAKEIEKAAIEAVGKGWTKKALAGSMRMSENNLDYWFKKIGISWKEMKAAVKHIKITKKQNKKPKNQGKPQKGKAGDLASAKPPPNGAGKMKIPKKITEEWVEQVLIHLAFNAAPTREEIAVTKMLADWLDKKKALTTVKSEVMNLGKDRVKELMG